MAFTTRTGKVANVAWETATRGTDEVITFTRTPASGSFAEFWDFPLGTHGHHIIPKAKEISGHPIIQKAAKSKSGNVSEFPFHTHDIENGIALLPHQHLPNLPVPAHTQYSNLVRNELKRVVALAIARV